MRQLDMGVETASYFHASSSNFHTQLVCAYQLNALRDAPFSNVLAVKLWEKETGHRKRLTFMEGYATGAQ